MCVCISIYLYLYTGAAKKFIHMTCLHLLLSVYIITILIQLFPFLKHIYIFLTYMYTHIQLCVKNQRQNSSLVSHEPKSTGFIFLFPFFFSQVCIKRVSTIFLSTQPSSPSCFHPAPPIGHRGHCSSSFHIHNLHSKQGERQGSLENRLQLAHCHT